MTTNTDIKTRMSYQHIAEVLANNITDASDIDGDVLAELLDLPELVLLQKQIAKAIERRVIG
jgi:hypothetical protein